MEIRPVLEASSMRGRFMTGGKWIKTERRLTHLDCKHFRRAGRAVASDRAAIISKSVYQS